MIVVRDLRKVYPTRFGEKVVLEGISFDLAMGERLGVLGRNGAGKSTMVRLISGAERPTSGTIERHMSVSWPLAFGGAFQPMLTGVDNVHFISRIYEQDFESNLAFVEDFAELGPYLREPVRTYSSGMRARLAFAISMIIEFDCFLIDEIGAVGDARFHDRCNYELFHKRANRAMVIISHDAGYVRDHCNRWAVLNQGHLALYDDFEQAYSNYREQIGLAPKQVSDSVVTSSRTALIEASQHRALRDEHFRLLVREGDWRRDAGDWSEAEMRYEAALALYPYQRSFWAQLGNVARERGAFARAEICYRTACALGEPVQDLYDFVADAMTHQNSDVRNWPIHTYQPGPASIQAPGRPDFELFSRLLWHRTSIEDDELVDLLRRNDTCDELLSSMIDDPRFELANGDWLESVRATGDWTGGNATLPARPQHPAGEGDSGAPEWVRDICAIALPHSEQGDTRTLVDEISTIESAWPILISAEGFSDWPMTQFVLKKIVASQSRSQLYV